MLSDGSPYKVSDVFGEMDFDQINTDVERFYTKYTVERGLEGIDPKDVDAVFFLYMSQYLIHKDELFSEKLN